MSFGASPSDVLTLANLMHRTYKNWKNACGDHASTTSLLGSAHDVLDELQALAKQRKLGRIDGSLRLSDLLRACERTTEGLNDIVMRYCSLGKTKGKTWDRIRFGSKRDDLARFERQLHTHISLLNTFLSAKNTTTLHEQREVLDTILDQIRQNLVNENDVNDDAVTVCSKWTDVDGDDLKDWRVLRRELLSLGFDFSFLKKQQHHIKPIVKGIREQSDERALQL
ncbi:MAG: hypothetical protein Q9159_000061 [Coniocarpon cinnabarinum]